MYLVSLSSFHTIPCTTKFPAELNVLFVFIRPTDSTIMYIKFIDLNVSIFKLAEETFKYEKNLFQLCYIFLQITIQELHNQSNASVVLTFVVWICRWSSQFLIKNNPVLPWVIQSMVRTSSGKSKTIYTLKCRLWVLLGAVCTL